MNESVRRFWAGALTPSLLAIVVMLCVNLGTIAVALALVDQDFVARHGRWLAANRFDYDILVTTGALDLARSEADRPLVVVLGNSTMRAMFSEQALREHLQQLAADAPSVHKFCTSRQAVLDAAAIIERIPDGSAGVVVLGLSPGMMTLGARELQNAGGSSRYGFRSDLYDEGMRGAGLKVAPRSRLYAVDNAAFLSVRVPRLAINLLLGRRIEFVESGYLGAQPDRVAFEAQGRLYGHLWQDYAARSDESLRALDAIRERLASRTRMRLLLVEPPVNPDFPGDYPVVAKVYAAHAQTMRDYAAAAQLPYVTPAAAISVGHADFIDGIHLGNPDLFKAHGRWLAERVVERLQAPTSAGDLQ